MRRTGWYLVLGAATLLHVDAAAQNPRTLEIGGPPRDTVVRRCATDSFVKAAVDRFNAAGPAQKVYGGDFAIVEPRVTIGGSYRVYGATYVRIDGTVQGNVVVLNGEVRIRSTAVIGGSVTIMGGRLTLDSGAQVAGTVSSCEQTVPLSRTSDGTIVRAAPRPSIVSIRSAATWDIGEFRLTPHLGVSGYNRVEGMPGELGVNIWRPVNRSDTLRAELYGILRTARDPSGSRPSVGWYGSVAWSHQGALPVTVTFAGGSTLRPTRDRPFSTMESGVSAVLFRRDYNDWFLKRGAGITIDVRPTPAVTLSGGYEVAQQTSVLATGAFSLLRSNEAWRPNPLVDDGRYRIGSMRATWDARDERQHPVLSWYMRAELRRVSSSGLTPVSLPTTIRYALPTHDYGATDADIDLRAYLRLNPSQSVSFRIAGGGFVGGDPLTIQNRRAIGGVDPLLGYDFRAINCDRRRKTDQAIPALCDRTMAIQAEYHRTLPLDLTTTVIGYPIGIRNPDLVLLADIGSAWEVGDSAGRVPTNRIQSLREWRSDVGIGITSGPFGLYLAKSLVNAFPVHLSLLLSKHF